MGLNRRRQFLTAARRRLLKRVKQNGRTNQYPVEHNWWMIYACCGVKAASHFREESRVVPIDAKLGNEEMFRAKCAGACTYPRCLRLIYPNSRRCRASANLVRAACFIYRPTRANAVFSHSYAHAKWMCERGWLTGWDRRERAFYRSAHKRIQPAQRLDCSNHFFTFSPAFLTAIKIYHHRLWLLQSMNITMHYIPLHLPFMLVKVYKPAWKSVEKAKIKTAKQRKISKMCGKKKQFTFWHLVLPKQYCKLSPYPV